MKKWIALLFAGIMVAGIIGCGEKPAENGGGEATPAPQPKDPGGTKAPEGTTPPSTDSTTSPSTPSGGEAPKTDGAGTTPPTGGEAPKTEGAK